MIAGKKVLYTIHDCNCKLVHGVHCKYKLVIKFRIANISSSSSELQVLKLSLRFIIASKDSHTV